MSKLTIWPLPALTIALLANACGRGRVQEPPAPSGNVSTVASAAPAPADHLAPGELAEGTDRAFDVPLPREVQVRRSYVDAIFATGPVALHPLVKYFASHLVGGSLREGPEAATFEHVKAHGNPDRELVVRLTSRVGGANVEIHKLTRPAAPNLPDESSRWRQVGLTPDGKLADPAHLD